MDNVFSQGVLMTVAATLVSVGVATIGSSLWTGIACLVLGAAVYVAREVLKKYGFNVGAALKRKK